MRVKFRWLAALVVAAVAVPVMASIKALTLKELMSITDDVVFGTIVSKDSLGLDRPRAGAVYTKLVVEGESLRSGERGTWEVVFHGSHFEKDWYTISEMPTLQDTRVGGETVLFFDRSEWHSGKNLVFDYSGLYRVERAFGEPVVIGKGPGSAFTENVKLAAAREQVRAAHLELEVEKNQAAGK